MAERLLDRWLSAWRRAPEPQGPHRALRIGLVADELTRSCLARECRVLDLEPGCDRTGLSRRAIDLLFVESAWQGAANRWKYRIAAYPDHPERTNEALARLVGHARDLGIPTVFWNKEDGVHFDRFIDSARLFEVVLTVDASCVPRYRARLGSDARVGVLPFAVQPQIHAFDGIDPNRRGACFVGSYSQHIHAGRRARQEGLMSAAAATLGLTVYDRNSDRRGSHYRYPAFPGLRTRRKVPHERTAAVYKSHLASLNVNTIEDSDTMFSRRLIEIMACGGLAVTTPAQSVDSLFRDCCHVVHTPEEARGLFERLARTGYDAGDREMIHEAATRVLREHTYARRLDAVLDAIGRGGRAGG